MTIFTICPSNCFIAWQYFREVLKLMGEKWVVLIINLFIEINSFISLIFCNIWRWNYGIIIVVNVETNNIQQWHSEAMLRKLQKCTHRIFFFEILLNQTEIKLYLPFSDWFGTKRTSVWFQINRKMVNTIWFRLELMRFRKDFFFSVCRDI